MRMTPLLDKHSDIHWEKVVAFILILVFIISVFGIQKSLRNPNFGFDFLATVRFGFQKSEPNRISGYRTFLVSGTWLGSTGWA